MSLSAAVVAGLLAVAQSSSAQEADEPLDKIQPQLMATLEAEQTSDFWIRLDGQADLTAASEIDDWDARGAAVVDALRDTAVEHQADVVAALDEAGARYESFWITDAILVQDGSLELAESLAQRADVAQLRPSQTLDPVEPVETSPGHSTQAVEWGLTNINADDVWASGITGENIVVANIDTGVQYDHPALVASYRGNNGDGTFDHDYNWLDTSQACDDESPCDDEGHGTHTMGTMVGSDGGSNQIGVAPGATWITANGCATCSDADLMESAQWMLAPTRVDGTDPDPSKRPHIINNSWGYGIPSTNPMFEDVSLAWAASGMFAVWANGNSGPSCKTAEAPGSRIISYSVGAYDIRDRLASFSSRGSGQDGEVKPNIAAPGSTVWSSMPGSSYGYASGTSMAAPHVAGAIALLWSAEPARIGDLAGTRELLDETARDTPYSTCGGTDDDNNGFGEGRLDAWALVEAGDVGATGVIGGTVTAAAEGNALAGVTVQIVGGDVHRSVPVGNDGRYELALPVGSYAVTATKFGYTTQTVDIDVAEDATVTQDFALELAPLGTLHGTVTDGSGHGWPLYATVTVAGVPAGTTFTDPLTGEYSIEVPVGTYDVTVESTYPGYETVTESIEITADMAARDLAVSADLAQCSAAGYAWQLDGTTTDFDGGHLPEGWSVMDHAGTDGVWRFDNPGERANLTGGSGEFAIVDTSYYGAGAEQDTSLVSPVYDLSEHTDPSIRFQQDLNYIGGVVSPEKSDIDVSIDGGQTWKTVRKQREKFRGPLLTEIPIPMAAGQSQVQVRFHYYDSSFNFWWQVDDVFVGTSQCLPSVDGGYVVGAVRDANTDEPVNGAQVTSGDTTVPTVATPQDPGLPDGFFWTFSADGTREFAAGFHRYVTRPADVEVPADGVVWADLALDAGRIEVTPAEVTQTLRIGDNPTTHSVTVTNTGTASAEVSVGEAGGGFAPTAYPTSEPRATSATETPLHRLNVPTSTQAFAPADESSAESEAEPTDPTDPAGTTAETTAETGTWTKVANYPRTVMDNRIVTVDGTAYSIGGSSGEGPLERNWAFDLDAGTWTRIADLPIATSSVVAGEIDGTVVVSGGWTLDGTTGATYVYDPGSDTWAEKSANPQPRGNAGQAVLDGWLYSIGGCVGTCTPTSTTVMRYDPASDTWEQRADYPISVAFLACGGFGDRIVCSGGTDNGQATADTYSYDPTTDAWTQGADAPTDIWGSAYAMANGQLVLSGGSQDGGAVSNATYAYEPTADTWVRLPNAPSARYRGAGVCGFLRVGGSVFGLSPETNADVLQGYDDCSTDPVDVEWVSASPTTMTLQPGDSATVDVVVTSEVDQPGTYQAQLTVAENTPYRVDAVQVTLDATPASTSGKVEFVVEAKQCDGSTAPLDDAVVAVDSVAGAWTLTTSGGGRAARWFDATDQGLAIAASYPGHRPQAKFTNVRPRRTTTITVVLDDMSC